MTTHVSVALFRRNGQMTFKPPRKEAGDNVTQARKSAARFWRGNIQDPDKLDRIVVVTTAGSVVTVSERNAKSDRSKWVETRMTPRQASGFPHIAACLAELGVDPNRTPPEIPDVLEINGIVYRREI